MRRLTPAVVVDDASPRLLLAASPIILVAVVTTVGVFAAPRVWRWSVA